MDKILAILILGPLLLLGGIAIVFIIDLVMAWPLMWAWNYVIPGMFNLPKLDYWHSFCLLVVASLLIKSHSSPSSKS